MCIGTLTSSTAAPSFLYVADACSTAARTSDWRTGISSPSLSTPISNGIHRSDPPSPSPAVAANDAALANATATLSLDERTQKAAEADPEFAAALQRQRDRELEQAKLMCSLENKEACLMCSG